MHKRFRLQQCLTQVATTVKQPARLGKANWRSMLALGYYAPAAALDYLRLHRLRTQSPAG